MRRFVLSTAAALLTAVSIAACQPQAADPETIVDRVTEGDLAAGDQIPVPEGDVVLTVTGDIANPNAGDSIEMDMATIESVGLVDYTVEDPFEGGEVTFRGVLMSDLLDLWGVSDDATTLSMTALNDYTVEVPISDMREYPVIFAVMQDGEYMLVENRGPAMLVYPYADFEFDHAVYDNYWIWQLKSIDVH